MLTLTKAKEEMQRVVDLIGVENLSYETYASNCQHGYAVHFLKTELNLTFSELKHECGYKSRLTRKDKEERDKVVIPVKIFCQSMNDGEGAMINKNFCVPDCRPACKGCKNIQLTNPGIINQMTDKEHRDSVLDRPCLNQTTIYNEEGR